MSSLNIKQSFNEYCNDHHHEEDKSDLGIPCVRQEIKFENEELVVRRFDPSMQFVTLIITFVILLMIYINNILRIIELFQSKIHRSFFFNTILS